MPAFSRSESFQPVRDQPISDQRDRDRPDSDGSFLPGGESFTWSGAFASAGEDMETSTDIRPDSCTDADIDTASFSYESALRAAIRFPVQGMASDAPDDLDSSLTLTPGSPASESLTSESPASELPAANRSASVTIRLSAAECAQLKQRAAEAGLTLSAYVRSCTFEAEALRSQVKQAVRELRGELRGELPAELRSGLPAHPGNDTGNDPGTEARRDRRAEAPEKKTPASEPFPPSAPAGESPRPWWQLRSSPKNLSVQA